MYKTKYVRGLCDLHKCQEPRVAEDIYCKRHGSYHRYAQSFNMGLRSRYLYDLEQAKQGLTQSLEQGLVEDIKRHTWNLQWIPLALEELEHVTIDGSISYLALPEKRNHHD